MFNYKGCQYKPLYRTATAAAVIDDAYWRRESLLFWIYCVVESKTASDLPAKAKKLTAKTWNKLPHEIQNGVGQDADVQADIMDCLGRGACWYIAIEGTGWSPGAKKGAADVNTIQATLEWIEQFRSKSAISGSKLLWAEITSQVKQVK